LIASAGALGGAGRFVGWATVVPAGAVYLGGSGVTSSNGALLGSAVTLSVPLWPGDQVWVVTGSGTAPVGVLQFGV
jgi:hypothetical protein